MPSGNGISKTFAVGNHILVLKIGRLPTGLLNIVSIVVVDIVSTYFHPVVQKRAGCIETSQIRGGDTIATAPASLATAHASATTHHNHHHIAGPVGGTTIVGIVGIENKA